MNIVRKWPQKFLTRTNLLLFQRNFIPFLLTNHLYLSKRQQLNDSQYKNSHSYVGMNKHYVKCWQHLSLSIWDENEFWGVSCCFLRFCYKWRAFKMCCIISFVCLLLFKFMSLNKNEFESCERDKQSMQNKDIPFLYHYNVTYI